MPDTDGFEVRAFDCNVHVVGECPEALTVLDHYVFPSLPRTARTSGQPDIFIRIARAGDQFQLLVNEALMASARHAKGLGTNLIRVLDEAVLQRLTTFRAVHAGAVLLRGRALLLPGSTHAGKSSLVAELLRRGATYFSDEYALIDKEGRVHPYPRPLLVRNGSPEQFPVLPGECNAPTGSAPVPVGWILSLVYLAACTWNVAAIPQSEALLTLLRNTPHVLAESPEMVDVFQCAVSGAACYTGRRNEAVHAVDQILRLIDRAA